MKNERVTEEEIYAAVRSTGCADMEEVLGVVLETDGSFSVIQKKQGDIRMPSLKHLKQS